RRCLQKDVRKRLQHAGDVRIELESDETEVRAEVQSQAPTSRRTVAFVTAALVLGAALAAPLAWWLKSVPAQPVRRFAVGIPGTMSLRAGLVGIDIALAPTGDAIVYAAGGNLRDQLVRRTLDGRPPEPVAGSGFGASFPFFSPDGTTVGFFQQRK